MMHCAFLFQIKKNVFVVFYFEVSQLSSFVFQV